MSLDHGAAPSDLPTSAVALDAHVPGDAAEAADLDVLRAVARSSGPWARSSALHLTASALVVHPPTARVLLRWHRRLQAWLQVGGHGDPGEVDPLAIALREAREETGLADLRPWPASSRPAILHAVIVDVPANAVEPAHRHGDLRYVLATASPDAIVAEDDDAPLRWLSLPEAHQLTGEANLQETLRRLEAILRGDIIPG
jgi:8-oxo-dGTP pyrophosphatase MutT (NUDIX family)